MSKKTIEPKISLEPDGIKVQKIANFFSRFAAIIAGVTQKIFLIAMRMAGKEKEGTFALPKTNDTTTKAEELPESAWVFGCSAGAVGEITTIYDQKEYPNIYAGPTNGGVMPLDENPWPVFTDSSATDPSVPAALKGDDVTGVYHSNPLVTSIKGVDGRTTLCTIDDYSVNYESPTPDPYTGTDEGSSVP